MERRQTPRKTISQILDEMQAQADEQHSGDLPTYALAIFNTLPKGDQRTFLRKSITLHWRDQIERAQASMTDIVVDDIRIDPISVEKERIDIEELNRVELIKMKTWLNKVIFIAGLGSFVIFIFVVIMNDRLASKGWSIFEMFEDVIKLMIG